MITWIKNEYKAFKSSRTIRLAYAQKALAVVTAILALIPSFRGYLTPELFIAVTGVFGVIANVLRKKTSSAIGDK